MVLASIVAVSVWGLNFGLDFTGGSLLEIRFLQDRPSGAAVRENLASIIDGVQIQPSGEKEMILRFRHASEDEHQAILNKLKAFGEAEELRFDTIGPTIGAELRQKAILALALAIAAIILYIAWAFRKVSNPVSSWKYGVVAIIALIHDVVIPTGIFAFLGEWKGVEVDTLFITALLTILGFSVHDTIVVFDRIRENLRNQKALAGSEMRPEVFALIVNASIKETVARSLNTSLTVLLVLSAVFILGGETTKYFSLALMLGIIFGTYSSIFVASPLLVVWNNWTQRQRRV